MMKRFLAFSLCFLIALSAFGSFPVEAKAAKNTNVVLFDEANVHWLGSTKEYADTIDTMFSDNGVRRVAYAADRSGQSKNLKWGLVNKKGEFVAPPIYDEIKVHSNKYEYLYRYNLYNEMKLFEGGYTQAVRDGKMGLLNEQGEEVIPCEYDFVCLPSEGMCKIVKDGKMGYYNLEKKKVAVKPKYEIKKITGSEKGRPFEMGVITWESYAISAELVGDTSGAEKQMFDFNGGYALVPLEDNKYTYIKCDLIDKDGKSVLPKNKNGYTTYVGTTNQATGTLTYYPQFGDCLVFYEMSEKEFRYDWGGGKYCEEDGKNYVAGIATNGKIISKAIYGKGMIGDKNHAFHGYQRTEPIVIPQLKMYIADKFAGYTKNNDFTTSIYDFSGKTVYQTAKDEGNNYCAYIPGVKYILVDGEAALNAKGKVVFKNISFNHTPGKNPNAGDDYASDLGLAFGSKDIAVGTKSTAAIFDLKSGKVAFTAKTGTILNVPDKASNLILVREKKDEYTIYDYKSGKKLFSSLENVESHLDCDVPFVIIKKGGAFGVINSKGKELLKTAYSKIGVAADPRYVVTVDKKTGETGLYDLEKKAWMMGPVAKDYEIRSTDNISTTGIIDVYAANKSKVKGYMYNIRTGAKLEYDSKYSSSFGINEPTRTSWSSKAKQLIGSDLKPVYEEKDYKVGNVVDSRFTVAWVVKGDKFGYINSAYLSHPTLPKALGDTKKTAYGSEKGFVNAMSGAEAEKSEKDKPSELEAPTIYNTSTKDRTITFSIKAGRWSDKVELEFSYDENFVGATTREITAKLGENNASVSTTVLSTKNEYYYRMRYVLDDGTRSPWLTGTILPKGGVKLYRESNKEQVKITSLTSPKKGTVEFTWETENVKQYGVVYIQYAKAESIKSGKYPDNTSSFNVKGKTTSKTIEGLESGTDYMLRMYVGYDKLPGTCWSEWSTVHVQ